MGNTINLENRAKICLSAREDKCSGICMVETVPHFQTQDVFVCILTTCCRLRWVTNTADRAHENKIMPH